MLSKDIFCKAINNIQTQRQKISDFNDALDKICDGFPVFDSDNLYLQSLLEILKETMNDKDDFIEWWLYENVDKTVTTFDKDGTCKNVYLIETPEELYDFLIKEYSSI